MLSQYVEEAYALDLLTESTESTGYLLKDRVADVDTFADAVRRVAGGGSALDPEVVALLLGRRRREDPLRGASTAREREVLGLMAEGQLQRGHRRGARWSPSGRSRSTSTSIFCKLDLTPTRGRSPPRAGRAGLPALRLAGAGVRLAAPRALEAPRPAPPGRCVILGA